MISCPRISAGEHGRLLQLLATLGLIAMLTITTGCNNGKSMGRVRGKVFFKDGTVPRGGVCVVSLLPTSASNATVRKGASSAIEPDGSFDMMTRTPGDGAYYGDYAVTFTVLKGPYDPTSLILPKYSSLTETPYKLTVDGNKEDLRYEIEPAASGAAGADASGTKPPGG